MYVVSRTRNSMSRKNRNYLRTPEERCGAVNVAEECPRARGRIFSRRTNKGREKRKGANCAPALNSGYTELDISRMTSSPEPSPNALFARPRCALGLQLTDGALRVFRTWMTVLNSQSSCSASQSLPPTAEVHPLHVYVLASTALVPHLVHSFTTPSKWGLLVAEQDTRFACLCRCTPHICKYPVCLCRAC